MAFFKAVLQTVFVQYNVIKKKKKCFTSNCHKHWIIEYLYSNTKLGGNYNDNPKKCVALRFS